MRLTQYQNSLLYMLKAMLKNEEITEEEIICVFLALKTNEQVKEMVDYMLKKPNITSSEILERITRQK